MADKRILIYKMFNAPDIIAPTQVKNVTATPGIGQVTLTWSAATDKKGVVGYRIKMSTFSDMTGAIIAVADCPDLIATVNNLSDLATYYFTVEARDAAYNYGEPSSIISCSPIDITDPSQVQGLIVTSRFAGANLTWNPSYDARGVTGYMVERALNSDFTEGLVVHTNNLNAISYNTPRIPNNVNHYFRISARDAAGNWSVPSAAGLAQPSSFLTYEDTITLGFNNLSIVPKLVNPIPININETITLGLNSLNISVLPAQTPTRIWILGTGNSDSQIPLYWSAASDDVAVTKYRIKKSINNDMSNSELVTDSLNTTSYLVPSLTNNTKYYFTVEAGDDAGYWGPVSPIVSGTPKTTIFFDDFNRSNGSVGVNWASRMGSFSIVSNRVSGVMGTGYGIIDAIAAGILTDVQVSIKLESLTYTGLSIRGSGTSGYFARLGGSGNDLGIYFYPTLNSAGSLGSISNAGFIAGDIFTFKAVGNTLSVLKNYVPILVVTSSYYSSGYAGLWAGNSTASYYDDFKIEYAT